jgi:hypothetical protein
MKHQPSCSLLILAAAALSSSASAQFIDAHEVPPAGYTGHVFHLSQTYPTTKPTGEAKPWKSIDYKTHAAEYLNAVLNYCYEGNIQVDWDVQNNAVRKWYHAPWMHRENQGREFIRGTTRERTTPPKRLHASQTSRFTAYAVGIYNAPGGWTIGQVWKDPDNPDPSKARFPEGTVSCKLLFTAATPDQVPYLAGSPEWTVFGADSFTATPRHQMTVRLLQIDVAVKDDRAKGTSGWVFGTFNYNSAAPGATAWEKMVPVGLMWGNDPTLKPQNYRTGKRPTQSVIIPANVMANTATDWKGLGWLERLNGPIDNPASACLSCHGTAEWPRTASTPMYMGTLTWSQVNSTDPFTPDDVAAITQKMRWFRNLKTQPFDSGNLSLDYSLQLFEGIQSWFNAVGNTR